MIAPSYAAPVDTVTHDAGARRLVVIVTLAAITLALVLDPLATILFNAVDRTAFATLAALFELPFRSGSGLTFAIEATVTSGASGDALPAEQLRLSAAVVAFATATILRPEPRPTA